MKKKHLALAFAAMGTTRMILKRKKKRDKLMNEIAEMRYKNELGEDLNRSIDAAGKPGQLKESDLENANMVAEGSQFGVQYYNDLESREPTSSKNKS